MEFSRRWGWKGRKVGEKSRKIEAVEFAWYSGSDGKDYKEVVGEEWSDGMVNDNFIIFGRNY